MDEVGRIKFQADGDSENSKGFCSYLSWMLDGAKAGEVLAVETRNLQDRKAQALVTERKQGIRGIMSNEILVVISSYKFTDFPDHNRSRQPLKQLCE
ncbi:hypothetical protein ACFX2C_028598 [Malus domestica]